VNAKEMPMLQRLVKFLILILAGMERVIANASRKDVLKNCDGVIQNVRWK
jgi:hypothetical protein